MPTEDKGQVVETPNTSEEAQTQEVVESSKPLTIKERIEQSLKPSETSNETIENGVESEGEAKSLEADEGEEAVEPAKSKYQVVLDKIYTFGEGDDAQNYTGEELQQNLLRRKDYTEKTQKLAEERKTLQNTEKTYVEDLKFFGAANKAALMQYQNMNWTDLHARDPIAYEQERNQLEILTQRQKQLDGAKANFESTMKAQAEKKQAEIREAFDKNIINYIPDWTKESRKEYASLTEHYDITPEEIENISDPRVFAMAKDALKAREAVTKAKELVKSTPEKAIKPKNAVLAKTNNKQMSVQDRLKSALFK